MRDLRTLINTILLFIPEENFQDTIRKLNAISESASYAPPEMQGYWFSETAKVLNELPIIGKEFPTWLKVVYYIFTATPCKDI